MISTLDPLGMRRRLGRDEWGVPVEFGPAGWRFDALDGSARIIVTDSELPTGLDCWRHASISRLDSMPTYDDLVLLHAAAWPDGHAYQVFVPPSEHVNIHAHALHLWGRPDGRRMLPDFTGGLGSI